MRYLILLLLFPFTLNAQSVLTDTIYLDKDFERILSKDTAYYFRPPIKKLDDTHYLIEDRYMSSRALQMSRMFLDTSGEVGDGITVYYYENGKKEHEGYSVNGEKNGRCTHYYQEGNVKLIESYEMGSRHGEWIYYYKNENILRHEKYSYGELLSGKCYTKSGRDTAYFPDHSIPTFPGGDEYFNEYILRKMKYPHECWRKGITGTVHVVVDFDDKGKFDKARITKKLHPLLDAEALRLVNAMPDWEPAIDEGGKTIKSHRNLSIIFEK